MEEITPGLYSELEDVFGWQVQITIGGKKAPAAMKPQRVPWPELDPAALHGLPGDVVRAVEPLARRTRWRYWRTLWRLSVMRPGKERSRGSGETSIT